jgi:hypothetical protein
MHRLCLCHTLVASLHSHICHATPIEHPDYLFNKILRLQSYINPNCAEASNSYSNTASSTSSSDLQAEASKFCSYSKAISTNILDRRSKTLICCIFMFQKRPSPLAPSMPAEAKRVQCQHYSIPCSFSITLHTATLGQKYDSSRILVHELEMLPCKVDSQMSLTLITSTNRKSLSGSGLHSIRHAFKEDMYARFTLITMCRTVYVIGLCCTS